MVNTIYILFHMFKKTKKDFNLRILNLLYSHYATILQMGSVIVLLLVMKERHVINFTDENFLGKSLLQSRYVQLMMVFICNFMISIATNINNFNPNLYLDMSFHLSKAPTFWFIFVLSLFVNILIAILCQVLK